MYSITKNRSCRVGITTKAKAVSPFIAFHRYSNPHHIVIQRMSNSRQEVLERFKKEVLEEGILHKADTLGAEDETLL